jgi:hypothetical protein
MGGWALEPAAADLVSDLQINVINLTKTARASGSHAPHGNAAWMRRIQYNSLHDIGKQRPATQAEMGSHAAHGNQRSVKLMTLISRKEIHYPGR